MPYSAPEVFIDTTSQAAYAAVEVITFDAEVFDLQDDVLDDVQLVWRSNISGILGSGIPLKVGGLPAGVHKITLSATNSFGVSASDVVTVVVSNSFRRRASRR